MVTPKQKAMVVTTIFSLLGILECFRLTSNWQIYLPLILFYITITINMYHSVVLFSGITPKEMKTQHMLDGLLIISYLGLAFNFNHPINFIFSDLMLFIIASAKYAFLLHKVHHPILLKRKILIDILGTLWAALALGTILLGYAMLSVWGLALGFIFVNILLFFVWPLYKLDALIQKAN